MYIPRPMYTLTIPVKEETEGKKRMGKTISNFFSSQVRMHASRKATNTSIFFCFFFLIFISHVSIFKLVFFLFLFFFSVCIIISFLLFFFFFNLFIFFFLSQNETIPEREQMPPTGQ